MNRYRERDEDSDEDKEKREKEQRIKEKVRLIESTLYVVNTILTRQRNVRDPVVRYSMFIEKFLMAIDLGVGAIKVLIDDEIPLETRDRIDQAAETLQHDLTDLLDWIQHPIYSPDHPYGKQILNESKSHFDNGSDQVKK